MRVSGAVTSPASILWERGKGFDYYIANAGGFARNADKGRTSVHYANGSAETRSTAVRSPSASNAPISRSRKSRPSASAISLAPIEP